MTLDKDEHICTEVTKWKTEGEKHKKTKRVI